MKRPVRNTLTRLFAVAVVGSTACGGGLPQPAPAAPAAPAARADSAGVAGADYAAPGDHLSLKIWGEAPMSGDLVVSPDGSVALPKAGLLHVSDIPATQLRDSIQHQLAGFLRDPSVDVTIQKRVVVNGAVSRSGVYFVDLGATVRDVIAQAGGLTEAGSATKIAVIRDGQTLAIPDWQQNDTPAAHLKSGDQILVGRRSWLQLNVLSVASLSLVVASFILSLRK